MRTHKILCDSAAAAAAATAAAAARCISATHKQRSLGTVKVAENRKQRRKPAAIDAASVKDNVLQLVVALRCTILSLKRTNNQVLYEIAHEFISNNPKPVVALRQLHSGLIHELYEMKL